MRFPRILALIVLAFLPTLIGWVQPPVLDVEEHVWIPMRDGVKLAANVFRPHGTAKMSAIVIRTPYGKDRWVSGNYQAFVDHGYAVVVQDVRGRYASEGHFNPLWQEPQDGNDTLNWVAAQPWCDGKIGMTGGSYLGISQWKVAVLNNPHLKAIFTVVSGDDDYRDRFYSPGGAMKWGHRLLWVSENLKEPGYVAPDFAQYIWTLPPRRAEKVVTGSRDSLLQPAFNHPSYDAFWKNISTREKLKNCKVPVFSVAGWYDNYVESDLDAFRQMRKYTGLSRIMIGPWPHNMSTPITTVDFGKDRLVPLRRSQLDWFDQWLKGKDRPLLSQPPVRLFVMGANEWRDENEWPLARAISTRFYLKSDGHANSFSGAGRLVARPERVNPQDRYVYDPRNPVPTMGGAVCCDNKIFPWGPLDQRPVEKRHDVLVYTTEPLTEDIEVTGPISLVLYAATSAKDTDFTAKLVDVYPDGRAINLTDGILRARYRDSLESPKLLATGDPVKYTIDVGVTSNLFRRGHRIRLEVSSSNFPRFDRNPNTGRPIADETQLLKASQTIFHDRAHPSQLILPVIPPKPALNTTRL